MRRREFLIAILAAASGSLEEVRARSEYDRDRNLASRYSEHVPIKIPGQSKETYFTGKPVEVYLPESDKPTWAPSQFRTNSILHRAYEMITNGVDGPIQVNGISQGEVRNGRITYHDRELDPIKHHFPKNMRSMADVGAGSGRMEAALDGKADVLFAVDCFPEPVAFMKGYLGLPKTSDGRPYESNIIVIRNKPDNPCLPEDSQDAIVQFYLHTGISRHPNLRMSQVDFENYCRKWWSNHYNALRKDRPSTDPSKILTLDFTMRDDIDNKENPCLTYSQAVDLIEDSAPLKVDKRNSGHLESIADRDIWVIISSPRNRRSYYFFHELFS